MNFYTSTFKKNYHPKKWIISTFILVFIVSLFIISFNFIIDPYNITKYNILKIKYKFARDDRTEKIYHFDKLDKFDNIMIGSSRVYSINPKKVSELLGGTTYNFGIGTACIEDSLGVLKYLKKKNKLPTNIILGVDFYTFNKNIPPNKYFIKNKELNFLSYSNYHEDYLSKLYSIDSFRASIKTLKNHFLNQNIKPRFDKLGWAGAYEDYSQRQLNKEMIEVKKETEDEITKIYSNYNYSSIDKKRISYFEEIKQICKNNHIKLFVFNTPLHPYLLNKLENHINTKKALNEFLSYLSTFDNFNNLYHDKRIYNNMKNFHGATHTSTNTGDIIIKILLPNNRL